VLGENHPDYALRLANLGQCLRRRRDFAAAAPLL
jgi:hypothetical protein